MELKVGDKVRFLNEKGGGIVSKLLSTTMVSVAIEEGFEMPVLVKDLIKIDPENAAGRFFDRPTNVAVPTRGQDQVYVKPTKESAPPVMEPEADDPVSPLFRQSGAGIIDGVYLAWVPHDQQWLITGNLDILLINNTEHDAIFSFLLEETANSFSGVNYDVIPPYSKILIETITREDLDAWSNGVVQVLFHNQDMQELLSPLHAHFKLKPVRFYKETSYQEFKLTGSKAIIMNLGEIASLRIPTGDSADMKGADLAAKQKVEALTPTALIDNHRTGPREAEVDLHISALRSDYSTMPQTEILLYQVDYFTRVLDSAIAFNYARVVFIHGIGNGTLKSSIINKLKDYENLELRKASFAQYGNGAIEIIIHSNNRD